MSFAVGELGLRLSDFYDMPWCEYVIKSRAYSRIEKDKWRHTRFIAFHALIAPHVDPKKLPRSPEKLLPLGDVKTIKKASELVKEQFIRETKEYLKKIGK